MSVKLLFGSAASPMGQRINQTFMPIAANRSERSWRLLKPYADLQNMMQFCNEARGLPLMLIPAFRNELDDAFRPVCRRENDERAGAPGC